MASSSAAPRPSPFISCTVKITRWWGTAFLMVRAKSIALTNSGRTLTGVLIFSERTGSHPASASASSWLWSSCRAVLQRAYPTLVGFMGPRGTAASMAGPISHAWPGPRSAGVRTSSSARSWGTSMKRGVWYFGAILPPRVRQVLPAGTSQVGHSNCATAAAGSAVSGMSQNLSRAALCESCLREVVRTRIRGKQDTPRRGSVTSQNYSFLRVGGACVGCVGAEWSGPVMWSWLGAGRDVQWVSGPKRCR